MVTLEQAFELADKGYKIFPLSKKIPVTKHGCMDASSEHKTIRQMLGSANYDNIGILCDNILVIDVDTKGDANGIVDLYEIERSLGELPKNAVVRTPSGGLHIYFKRPKGEFLGATKIEFNGRKTNIDIRVGNQYVVAPPSSIDNKEYVWLKGEKSYSELPELPDAWRVFLPKKKAVVRSPIVFTVPAGQRGNLDSRVTHYLDKIPPAIQGQAGQNAIYRAINIIFNYFNLSREEGWRYLEYFNATKCSPPWDLQDPTELRWIEYAINRAINTARERGAAYRNDVQTKNSRSTEGIYQQIKTYQEERRKRMKHPFLKLKIRCHEDVVRYFVTGDRRGRTDKQIVSDNLMQVVCHEDSRVEKEYREVGIKLGKKRYAWQKQRIERLFPWFDDYLNDRMVTQKELEEQKTREESKKEPAPFGLDLLREAREIESRLEQQRVPEVQSETPELIEEPDDEEPELLSDILTAVRDPSGFDFYVMKDQVVPPDLDISIADELEDIPEDLEDAEEELRKTERQLEKEELERAEAGIREMFHKGPTKDEIRGTLPNEYLDVPGFVGECLTAMQESAAVYNKHACFGGAMSLLSTLMGPKFACHGLRANMYTIVLGQSGAGKETPRTFNEKVLSEAIPNNNIVGRTFTSGEALEDALIKYGTKFYQVDECDFLFRNLGEGEQSFQRSIQTNLLEFYTKADGDIKRRDNAMNVKVNIPEEERRVWNPYLNLFGTAPIEHYYESLTARVTGGGLFGRFMIIKSRSGVFQRKKSLDLSPARFQRIVDFSSWLHNLRVDDADLSTIGASRGPCAFIDIPISDEAHEVFTQFAEEMRGAANRADTSESVCSVCNRSIEKVYKLAMIYSVSKHWADIRNLTVELHNDVADVEKIREALTIERDAAEWACKVTQLLIYYQLEDLEEKSYVNDYDKRVKSTLSFIRSISKTSRLKMVKVKNIYRKLSWMASETIDKILHDLIRQGLIVATKALDKAGRIHSGFSTELSKYVRMAAAT